MPIPNSGCAAPPSPGRPDAAPRARTGAPRTPCRRDCPGLRTRRTRAPSAGPATAQVPTSGDGQRERRTERSPRRPSLDVSLHTGQRADRRCPSVDSALLRSGSRGSSASACAYADLRARLSPRRVSRSPTSAHGTQLWGSTATARFKSASDAANAWSLANPAARRTSAGTEPGSYSSAVVASLDRGAGIPAVERALGGRLGVQRQDSRCDRHGADDRDRGGGQRSRQSALAR